MGPYELEYLQPKSRDMRVPYRELQGSFSASQVRLGLTPGGFRVDITSLGCC